MPCDSSVDQRRNPPTSPTSTVPWFGHARSRGARLLETTLAVAHKTATCGIWALVLSQCAGSGRGTPESIRSSGLEILHVSSSGGGTKPESIAGLPVFASEEEAARAAGLAGKILEQQQRQRDLALGREWPAYTGPEYCGRICARGNRFTYTIAAGLDREDFEKLRSRITESSRKDPGMTRSLPAGASRVDASSRPPKGWRQVAAWHTHPCSYGFSESDKAYANHTGQPLYVTRNGALGGLATEKWVPSDRARD